jgi:muramoyltetrapeptide carboxypeptidase
MNVWQCKGGISGRKFIILYSLLCGIEIGYWLQRQNLVIEDLDEYCTYADRMMMNLKRNGCLEIHKRNCVGSMTKWGQWNPLG